ILSESRSDAYESKAAFASSAPRAGPSCFTLGGSGSQTNGVARGGGCDSFRTSKAVPIATPPNATHQSRMSLVFGFVCKVGLTLWLSRLLLGKPTHSQLF